MQLRTFIALELPEVHKQAIQEHLNIWRRTYTKGINWVRNENLHLTLLFVGDTLSADIKPISEALFELILRTPCFSLNCLGFELFPAVEPRLLWVKLDSKDRSIFNFAKELNKAIREFGYEPDGKALKLHITVGRIKSQQPVWMEQEFLKASLVQESAIYNTITFYQSMLRPDGPVYTPLEQFTMIKQNN